jgi:hypothetical protein
LVKWNGKPPRKSQNHFSSAGASKTKRVGALANTVPHGDPVAVTEAFRKRLAEIDRAAEEAQAGARRYGAELVDRAKEGASNARADAEDRASRRVEGVEGAKNDAAERAAQVEERVREEARGRVAGIGGHGTPEGYGSAIRGALQHAKDEADAAESKLWRAVDPGNRLALEDVSRIIGGVFGKEDAVGLMKRIVQEASKDPDAMAGLKQAIVDHMMSKFISERAGSEKLRGEQFKRFVSSNLAPLSQVFSSRELGGVRAIADDLARSVRSIDSKMPGQSNTAQDQASESGDHHGVGWMTEAAVAGTEAHHAFGWLGAIVAKKLGDAMRSAGLKKVDDLVREMLLNPGLAHAALQRREGAHASARNMASVAHKLRRLSVFAPIGSHQQQAEE